MNRHGLKRETVELDKTIWEWSLSVPNVTKTMVQHYAKQLFTQAGLVTFKASDGWYRRWRKRWKHNPFLPKTATKTLQTEKDPMGSNDNKISTNNKTDDSACNIITTNMNGIIPNDNESLVTNQNDDGDNQNQNISYDNSNKSTIDTYLNNDIIDNILYMKEKINHIDNNYVDDIASDCMDVCLTSQNINNEQLISNENSGGISNCLDDENMVISMSPNDCNLTSPINEQQTISRNNTNFHIPRFSLSSDIFNNCNLLESGDEIFCKICGDFHVDDYRCNKILSESIIQINNDNSLLQLNSIIAPVDNDNNLNNDNNICNALSTSDNTNTKLSNRDLCSNNDTLLRTRRKGERYLPQFKSKVVAYTKTHSIKSTAIKFNVCEGTVSEWVKAKIKVHDDLQILQNKKQLKESKAEIGFIKWLSEMRNERRLLSQQIIRDKLDEFINKYKNDQPDKKPSKKSCWLNHYFERLRSTINEETSKNVSIEKKHIVYPAAFKMEVAMYAEKSSQQAAARVFCVARKRVYEWLEIMKTKGSIKNVKVNGTSYVTDSEVDNKIWLWYSSQEVTPTSFEVREMGRKLYKEKGHIINCSSGWFYRWRERFNLSPSKSLDYLLLEWILSELDKNKSVSHLDLLDHAVSLPHRTSFKASRGWALRFCKRYPSLLQRVPTANTLLPPSMELKVTEFRSHIQEIIINLGLSSDNIGTIDEVPVHFVHNGDKKKILLIRRPGFDNCQASLIVSSLVSGKLLPSVLVLKGTSDSTTLSSTKNVLVFSRKDGCVDEEIMLYWLENVWFRYQTGVSLLVSDHYQPHVCSMVKETIATSLCRYELFPPGCSSKLQPLSISISNLFKEKIERSWKDSREWSSWSHTSSFPGLPSQQEILTWITQAHNEIANQQEELVTSFQKTLLETNSSISDSSA